VKGRHNDENDKYVNLINLLEHSLLDNSLHIVMILKDHLQYNGLMFFFALAITNNALKGFKTLGDLMKARLLNDVTVTQSKSCRSKVLDSI
jgi:hypothetical protein